MELDKYCAFCGKKKEDQDKKLCAYCDSLESKKFYPIPTYTDCFKFYKERVGELSGTQRKTIKEFYKKNEDKVIGIMPTQCPVCERLSKNDLQPVPLENNEENKKYFNGEDIPKRHCEVCKLLMNSMKFRYGLKNSIIKKVFDIIKKNKYAEEVKGMPLHNLKG